MKVKIFDVNSGYFKQQPNRQYKFIIIWCRTGSIEMEIDDNCYRISKNQILTISPKQYYLLLNIDNAQGNILEFEYDFFCRDDKSTELIFYNGLFCHFGDNEIITVNVEKIIVNIETYLKEIDHELKLDEFETEEKLFSLIKLLIIELGRSKISQQKGHLYAPDTLFLNFLNTARENLNQRLSVKKLAEKVGSNENKINELAKIIAEDTTQHLLNDLIILEAKRFLLYEKMRVNEVAYKLGFSDPFYFSRFFKKHTSKSPSKYLAKYNK